MPWRAVLPAVPEDASLDDFLQGGDAEEEPADDGDAGEPSVDAGEPSSGSGSWESSADDEGVADGVASVDDDEAGGTDDGETATDETDDEAAEGSADGDDEDATIPPSAVEPVAATSRWAADGVTCPACDGSATRLWRDGDGLVCGDCKSWDGG